MRPATCQGNGAARRALPGEGRVSGVTITLHDALPVRRQDRLQALGGTAGLPVEDGISSGPRTGPQIAEFGLAMAGLQIPDRRFVDLHIAAREHLGAKGLVDRPQPVRGQSHPLRQRLAREVDAMPRGKDLLLSIQRKVIAVFTHDDRREQPRRGQAAILQRGQRGHDGCGIRMIPAHILAAHEPAFEEPGRFVVELFGHFFADLSPGFRTSFHRLRHEDLFDDRQMLGQARPAFTRRRRCGRRAPWGLRAHGLRGFSRSIESLQHQKQLRPVHLLALRAIQPVDQRIDLSRSSLFSSCASASFARSSASLVVGSGIARSTTQPRKMLIPF